MQIISACATKTNLHRVLQFRLLMQHLTILSISNVMSIWLCPIEKCGISLGLAGGVEESVSSGT